MSIFAKARNTRRGRANEPYDILLICSSGGHLAQLLLLKKWWERHRRSWVSFRLPDVESRLEGEQLIYAKWPTTRNIPNLILNTIIALRVLLRNRPDVIVSNGAGVAVPFFYIGRALGCRTVYVEVIDHKSTLTGRLVAPATDLFICQRPEQQTIYRKSVLAGSLYKVADI